MGADEYFTCLKSIRLDMLELMGSGYVIEHCVSVYSERCRDKAYKNYVADALMCISESTASCYGGSYLDTRYAELVGDVEVDDRTGDEIALDIIERAGLKVKCNGFDETGRDTDP